MTNKLTLSAPKYIWLQISDDADDLGQPMPAADETITWCADSVLAAEVGYVRADLNAALQATILAELLSGKGEV